ncbi:MAG: YabP/YqfC family sporulation protein [Clostridia bacterium]|nr:YabP/YqfC family sporulation protein [Clostridia bacterium]
MKRSKTGSDRGARRLAAMGLPADADCVLPKISLTGGRYLTVEHHTGILQLTPCLVRLYSRLGVIRIEGEGLAAPEMDGDEMLLEGEITLVAFENRKPAANGSKF